MSERQEIPPESVKYAMLGLGMLLVAIVVVIIVVVLCLMAIKKLGIDPNEGWKPLDHVGRTLLVMVSGVALVSAAYYLGVIIAVVITRPFVSLKTLRSQFVSQLSSRRFEVFHGRLFDVLFGRGSISRV